MNRVLVIGGTGTVGSQVVAQLSSNPIKVRVLARNVPTARFPSNIELVRGDLTLPETLDPHLDGVDTVFLVWTAPPATVVPVLEKIAKHARRIVFLSAPIKTAHPLFQQPSPLRPMVQQIEHLIETSGLEWTILRPGMFAANALSWWAPQIRTGNIVRWPHLSAPTAPIDERDIASVAVRALSEDGHHKAEYVLTGPESSTQFEQLTTISRVIGRSVEIEEITPDEARQELLPAMPLPIINMLLNAWGAAIGQPAFVTSTVADVTGTPAHPFADWAADHAAEFRA